jgi:rhomboid protease GluP
MIDAIRKQWLNEFRDARAVHATMILTCGVTLLQLFGRSLTPSIHWHDLLWATPAVFEQGEFWRPLTANFVHLLGISHLIVNMVGLALAGPFVESDYGALRYLLIYTVSGYVAWSLRAVRGLSGSGASAAVVGPIAALCVASIAHYAQSIRARRQLALALTLSIIWLGLGFVIDDRQLPFLGTVNIANDVHIVGFATGLILGIIFLSRRSPDQG